MFLITIAIASIALSIVYAFIVLFRTPCEEAFQYNSPSAIIPQCANVKKSDILNAFGGNLQLTERMIRISGVPRNVPFDDENAPLIATFLIGAFKVDISPMCRLPLNTS